MDYLREGRAAEEVAGNLARDAALWSHVRVPRIHWGNLTTQRVLAMEFIDGVKINDADGVARQGVSRDDLVAWASRAFLHMMFRDGFFHCDPHPGNLIVDGKGRIAIIDFGMNERLAPGVLAAVRDHLRASVLREPRAVRELARRGRRDRPARRGGRARDRRDRVRSRVLQPDAAGGGRLDFSQHFWRLRGQMVRCAASGCRPVW
jgi:predicted unusual protein kinase regulating ubiquinone biosynthesis (AarF/ABC1/UbiB family)